MSDSSQKPDFGSAVGGYSRKDVDAYLDTLLTRVNELESYNTLAVREQQSLRERVEELTEKLKNAASPGYAQLGAQFEETLRLAESEAGKLVNAAATEALKIREEARAEVDRKILDSDKLANKLMVEAERAAKTIRKDAETEAQNLKQDAVEKDKRAEIELQKAMQQKSLIENEANNYAAQKKAELQRELEQLNNFKSKLEKDIAELEANIEQRREDSEKEFAERAETARVEVETIYAEADDRLRAAIDEADSLLASAERIVNESQDKADQRMADAESMATALIQDARYRSERLSIRSLELTKNAISDAEFRLARLPEEQLEIEKFLEETRNLLTPEQEMLLRRKQIQESAKRQQLEGEVIEGDS